MRNKPRNKFLTKGLVITLLALSLVSNEISAASSLKLKKHGDNKNPQIETQTKDLNEINNNNIIENSEELSKIIEKQKELDLKDLEILWKATIENSPVIEFALKKASTPESQRRIQSSIMAKTLSALVSGASFVPSLMGTNPAIQSSAFSAGRIAQNLINKKNIPQEIPLTDTELIQLASMIEELQDSLITSYYNYKNTLMQIKNTRKKLILYSKNYGKAIKDNDKIEITVSSSLYNSMILEEITLEEEAKKYYVQLQRLAGKNAVKSMELKQHDFDSLLIKPTVSNENNQEGITK